MQKIIGLDIGSYSIKAVEIVNNFKSYEITNYYENVIPQIDEVPPEVVIPACMEQLFRENNLNADRIITAMPGQYISSRVLQFNFSDPHKIESAVIAEIEDAVPFNLDDMIVDHQIIGQMGSKTVTLVVMTKKVFLASFLEHLQRVDIDPKLVDVDSLAFYNLCPYLEMEQGKVYGLVDVGHEKTSVCIVRDGVLRMFRSINLGGRYLTEFLARDMELSFNDAQRLKHKVSQVFVNEQAIEGLDPESKLVADRLTVASNAIIKELGRTLYAFKTWEKAPIERIFLSGGTSIIKGFDEFVQDNLEVETVRSRLDQTDLQIDDQLSNSIHTMSQGISIGIRAVTSVKRQSQINLRKDEFAYVQDYEALLKSASYVFRIIAIGLLLLSISYASKYYSYSNQIAELQELYKKQFISMLPADMQKKYRRGKHSFEKLRRDAKVILRDRVDAKRMASQGFIKLNSDSGALITLKEVSKALPKDVKVNVVEYRYITKSEELGEVRLKIEADSFDTASKFQSAIKNVEVLDQVIEKSADSKPGADLKVAVYEANYIPQSSEK